MGDLLLGSHELWLVPRSASPRGSQSQRNLLASSDGGFRTKRVSPISLLLPRSNTLTSRSSSSVSYRTVFQLFNTRLSRGGKVEDCSGPICKKNTICMLRSMRSESNCVSSIHFFADTVRFLYWTKFVTGRDSTGIILQRSKTWYGCASIFLFPPTISLRMTHSSSYPRLRLSRNRIETRRRLRSKLCRLSRLRNCSLSHDIMTSSLARDQDSGVCFVD